MFHPKDTQNYCLVICFLLFITFLEIEALFQASQVCLCFVSSTKDPCAIISHHIYLHQLSSQLQHWKVLNLRKSANKHLLRSRSCNPPKLDFWWEILDLEKVSTWVGVEPRSQILPRKEVRFCYTYFYDGKLTTFTTRHLVGSKIHEIK